MRHSRKPIVVGCLLLASAYACGGHDVTAPDIVPVALDIVSGQEQSGQVGQELPQPLVVRVVNAAGDPIPGRLVNFRVVKGDGSVFAGASLTNEDGKAQERWTLGKSIADSQVVEARAVDPTSGDPIVFARFIAVVLAGPPTLLLKTSGDDQVDMAGSTLRQPLRVRVTDVYQNPVANTTINWVAGAGTLGHGSTVTDADGSASNSWTLGSASGSAIVTASVGNALSVQFAARSVSQAELVFRFSTGQDQRTTPGSAVLPPSVLITDGQDYRLPGIPVSFSVIKGGGTVTGGGAVTDDQGTASVGSWTLGSQVGVNLLSATLPGGASMTFFARAVQISPAVNAFIRGSTIGTTVGDDAPIQVAASSGNGIASVTATVAGRTTSLVPGGVLGSPDWVGTLSLAGTPQDTMTVIVTVTDKAGNITQDANLWTHNSAVARIEGLPSDAHERASASSGTVVWDRDPFVLRERVAVAKAVDARAVSTLYREARVSS